MSLPNWDQDVCDCGEVYNVADGHPYCNVRMRLRMKQLGHITTFVARPDPAVIAEEQRIEERGQGRNPR